MASQTGKVVSVKVARCGEGGLGTAKDDRRYICVYLADRRVIKNNWDHTSETHKCRDYDGKFNERLVKAADSIGEVIEWTTYGDDDPNEWFKEIM